MNLKNYHDFVLLYVCSLFFFSIQCYFFRIKNRLFEVVETLGRVHLVTEWIQGGELYNRITQDGPLKEVYAAMLFKQLLLGVQHMVNNLKYSHVYITSL